MIYSSEGRIQIVTTYYWKDECTNAAYILLIIENWNTPSGNDAVEVSVLENVQIDISEKLDSFLTHVF